MRETFGVPPVVDAEARARSRVPLWAWLFAVAGLSFMVTAGIVIERTVHLDRTKRASSSSAEARRIDPCGVAARKLERLSTRASSCGEAELAEALHSARSSIFLALETAHDDASKADAREACELVLDGLPNDVCP